MVIDEDDLSSDDGLNLETEGVQRRRPRNQTGARQPQLKYMDLLQKISDRYEDQITINLDDLAQVD